MELDSACRASSCVRQDAGIEIGVCDDDGQGRESIMMWTGTKAISGSRWMSTAWPRLGGKRVWWFREAGRRPAFGARGPLSQRAE